MISLGGGMPHPDTFPFESMTVTLKASGDGAPGKTLSISPQEMATALQYSATVSSASYRKLKSDQISLLRMGFRNWLDF